MKKIAVDDEVYEKIMTRKRTDESFSDFFLRLLGPSKNQATRLLELAGTWEDFPEIEEAYKNRKRRSRKVRVTL
jgi:predicted CopG family antitoxin